jgi:precorrin-2/cobalt-factor-2 C20-methyltransferase
MAARATLFVVGVGPGDPELMTLKAARIIREAPVLAWFCKAGRPGHASSIAGGLFTGSAEELRFEYPFTTEVELDDPRYLADMGSFYESTARTLAARLDRGQDVALLCEGDPFFYGSSMYLFDRLGPDYPTEIIPGITGMSGCWTRARLPMTHGDDVLAVLPGTLDEDALVAGLAGCDAAVIMKLGRNLPKVRAALDRAGLTHRAVYVERGTMADERMLPFAELGSDRAPYFALVLIPGRQRPR